MATFNNEYKVTDEVIGDICQLVADLWDIYGNKPLVDDVYETYLTYNIVPYDLVYDLVNRMEKLDRCIPT